MDPFEPDLVTAGMAALIGPANAGKSTLLNRLVGQKVSIVTPKPQTTRNRIAGVVSGAGYQIVFLDTPGLHRSTAPLNRELDRIARASLAEVEAVVFMLDASRERAGSGDPSGRDEWRRLLEPVRSPVFLVLNKIDLVAAGELLPIIDAAAGLHPFRAVIPLSARTGDGCSILVEELLGVLPRGLRIYPEDVPTDASVRFLSSEIIREKVFLETGQEIPYASAVLIDSFSEDEERGLVDIHATIYVERQSQKRIVIGSGGAKLKAIGAAARKEIAAMLEARVALHLWVKVRKRWSSDGRFLREMGI